MQVRYVGMVQRNSSTAYIGNLQAIKKWRTIYSRSSLSLQYSITVKLVKAFANIKWYGPQIRDGFEGTHQTCLQTPQILLYVQCQQILTTGQTSSECQLRYDVQIDFSVDQHPTKQMYNTITYKINNLMTSLPSKDLHKNVWNTMSALDNMYVPLVVKLQQKVFLFQVESGINQKRVLHT